MKKSQLKKIIEQVIKEADIISTEEVKDEIEKDGLEHAIIQYFGKNPKFEDKKLIMLWNNTYKSLDAIYKYLKM